MHPRLALTTDKIIVILARQCLSPTIITQQTSVITRRTKTMGTTTSLEDALQSPMEELTDLPML